ncbi:MAG: PleD family two-component system response regulator [Bacteroidales bacterium]
MKILLIDDSTINNIIMENLLSEYGYETYSLLESEKAINVIISYKPDLIILDLMMPGISGFDILKHMQEQSIAIPTLVVSAYKDEGYQKKVKELGALKYFTKPFDHKDLIKCIEEHIG